MSENINSSSLENLNDNPSSDTWSRQHTLILIQTLRNSPCLYNPLDPHFLNKSKRSEKLQLILNELKKFKKNVTLQCIKNKIRTLQSQISREKSKVVNSKASGASADEIYIPKLWCYKELSFLLHRNDCEPSTSNIDLIGEGEIETAEEASENETPKKRKTKVQDELRTEAIKMIAQSKNILEQRRKQPLTKEEEFCRYICSELKRLRLERSFQEVKFKIIELVSSKILEEQDILDEDIRGARISPSLAEGGIYKYRSHQSSTSTEPSSISPLPFPAQPKSFQYSTPEEDFYDNSQTCVSIPFPSKINRNKNLFEDSSTEENSYDHSQKCTSFPSYFKIIKAKQTIPEEPPQTSLSFLPESYSPPINSRLIPEIKINQQPTIFEQSSQTSTSISSYFKINKPKKNISEEPPQRSLSFLPEYYPSTNNSPLIPETYVSTIPTWHKIKPSKIKIIDNRIIKQADPQKPSTSKDILQMAKDVIGDF